MGIADVVYTFVSWGHSTRHLVPSRLPHRDVAICGSKPQTSVGRRTFEPVIREWNESPHLLVCKRCLTMPAFRTATLAVWDGPNYVYRLIGAPAPRVYRLGGGTTNATD